MIHIGFTGTQTGLVLPQYDALTWLLSELGASWLHHGDCIGADMEAHAIARSLGYSIFLHPPNVNTKRAFCDGAEEEALPKPYLTRNYDIVDQCTALIACPKGVEVARSGTWATVRYARIIRRKTIIIYPDGCMVSNE